VRASVTPWQRCSLDSQLLRGDFVCAVILQKFSIDRKVPTAHVGESVRSGSALSSFVIVGNTNISRIIGVRSSGGSAELARLRPRLRPSSTMASCPTLTVLFYAP
jgi:hypothetical protein